MHLRNHLQIVVLAMVAACGLARPASAETPAEQVDLLAMGDWGRGNALQKTVASAMAKYVSSLKAKPAALVTAGDNFYVPLTGIDDPNWKLVFEDMYDRTILDFPFYASLGNHDYEIAKGVTKPKAVIEQEYTAAHPESRWKFPKQWYRVDFPATGTPLVSVLMLNSNKQKLSPEEWAEELKFIDDELANRRGATWTVAVAHHPLFSNGAHGDVGPLKADWGDLFKKHKLDFYVAGHDHDLQHLELADNPTTFVLCGGGGATTRPMLRDNRGPFSTAHVGFLHLSLTPKLATLTFLNGQTGKPLHQFTRTPDGKTKITLDGPVDRATTKQLQTIQGLDQKKKKSSNDD